MNPAVQAFAAAVAEATGLPLEDVRSSIAAPPNPDMGDLGFPCFPLAKVRRKSPAAIALAPTLRLTLEG